MTPAATTFRPPHPVVHRHTKGESAVVRRLLIGIALGFFEFVFISAAGVRVHAGFRQRRWLLF